MVALDGVQRHKGGDRQGSRLVQGDRYRRRDNLRHGGRLFAVGDVDQEQPDGGTNRVHAGVVGVRAFRVRGGGEARHRDRRPQLPRLHVDGRSVDPLAPHDARTRVQRHERGGADFAQGEGAVSHRDRRHAEVRQAGLPGAANGRPGDRRHRGRPRAARPDRLLHAAQPVGGVRMGVRQDEPGGGRISHGQGDRRHEEVRRRPDRARTQVRAFRQLRGRLVMVDAEHARGVQGPARVRPASVPADPRRVQGERRERQGGGEEVPRRLHPHHQGTLPRRLLQDHPRKAFRRRSGTGVRALRRADRHADVRGVRGPPDDRVLVQTEPRPQDPRPARLGPVGWSRREAPQRRGGGGVHGRSRRVQLGRDAVPPEGCGRHAVLPRREPHDATHLSAPAVAGRVPPRQSDGTLGHAFRAQPDVGEERQGMVHVPQPLPGASPVGRAERGENRRTRHNAQRHPAHGPAPRVGRQPRVLRGEPFRASCVDEHAPSGRRQGGRVVRSRHRHDCAARSREPMRRHPASAVRQRLPRLAQAGGVARAERGQRLLPET